MHPIMVAEGDSYELKNAIPVEVVLYLTRYDVEDPVVKYMATDVSPGTTVRYARVGKPVA